MCVYDTCCILKGIIINHKPYTMSNKVLLSIVVSVGLALVTTLPVHARVLIDSSGAVILQSGEVLGENSGSGEDDDSGDDDSNEDSDSSEDSSDEKQIENQREAAKQAAEEKREAAKQTVEEKREAAKQAAEIKREEAKQKLEAQKKASKVRYILKQDGRKIRIDARDGQTRVRIEHKIEDGVEHEDDELESEIEDEQEIEIEPGKNAENTKLRVLRSKAIVERLRARAITSAPLSVNPETNELSITTKRGDVKVVVLPDAAIQNLIANNIVDEIVSEENDTETESAVEGEEEKDTVRLESEDESPVYKIAGIKRLRFLGILPFESKIDATVSAETGEVLERNQQLFKRFLSFFSTNAK